MNLKVVGYLRGLSEGLAVISEDMTFEVAHQRDVAYFAQKLAYERHLDMNAALMIAYGHDLGRLKNGVCGPGHAKESAKIVKKLLREFERDADEIKVVSQAIEKHSTKNRIGSDYIELIRDADSLAHRDEQILSDRVKDAYEWSRVRVVDNGDITLRLAEPQLWIDAFNQLSEAFSDIWQIESFEPDPHEWVHKARIMIRRIRSLIWLYEKSDGNDSMKAYDKTLKVVFKSLSRARMLHVIGVNQKEMGRHQSLDTQLGEALIKIRYKIEHIKIEPKRIEISSAFASSYAIWVKKAFHRFMKCVSIVDFDDIKSVHQARLSGKVMKDWLAMALIESSHELLTDCINDMHHSLGVLNDHYDMIALPHASRYFDKEKVQVIIDKMTEICKARLFIFKLYNRKTKENAWHYPSIIFDEKL